MRRAHYLKMNKAVELPSHCIFIDTETLPARIDETSVEAQLWFGWACYVRRHRTTRWTPPVWFRFTKLEDMWTWIEGYCLPKRKLYVFSHNLGFDATVTKAVRTLKARGWELKGAIIDDPPSVLKYRRGQESLVLMDTLNIFRMSLKAVGSFIGVQKAEMPELDRTQDEWDEYCRRDVEVLVSAMQQYWTLVRDWDLGNFQYTLASQAFAAFRHRFMKEAIFIDDNGKSHDLARAAYSGGRVECFQLGRLPGTVHCVDINSQYPYVMSTLEIPTKLITVLSRTKIVEMQELLAQYDICAEVDLETDTPIYPLKYDGRLVFPVGKFRASLCTAELVEALSRGHIQRVLRAGVYEKAVVFQEYVSYWWDARQQAKLDGNQALAFLCKLFLNSLYGKFGQSGRVYEEIDSTPSEDVKCWVEYDADTKQLHRYRQFGGLVQEQKREGEARDSHPAIAAHVTSAARLYLWQLIEQAGRGNVYYCDTDSLMVNDAGLERLSTSLDADKLGALKLEWSSDQVTINGPKDYQVDAKTKIKGIRSNAVDLGAGWFEQDLFRGFRGMLAKGDMDTMVITRVRKHLKREYQKGIVGAAGHVSPLRFPLQESQLLTAQQK